jgi:hypothetical protein
MTKRGLTKRVGAKIKDHKYKCRGEDKVRGTNKCRGTDRRGDDNNNYNQLTMGEVSIQCVLKV